MSGSTELMSYEDPSRLLRSARVSGFKPAPVATQHELHMALQGLFVQLHLPCVAALRPVGLGPGRAS